MSEPGCETTRARVLALIEEATQSEPGSLQRDSLLTALAGWDSMGMVMFMGLVLETFEVELSVFDLRECTTPAELAQCVSVRLDG